MEIWTIVGAAIAIAALAGGAIYWAGHMSAQVEMVVLILGEIKAGLISNSQDINELNKRVTHLEDKEQQ